MLIAALISLVGALTAFAGMTALVRGWLDTREGYLLACAVSLLSLSIGLGAATISLALGHQPALFRVYQICVAVLALLALALGMVELVATRLPAVFAARLLLVSFSIVATVILAVDPLNEASGLGAFAAASELYLDIPQTLLTVEHAGVVLIVSACFFAVAMRAWRGEEDTWDLFLPCLLLVLAVLFLFVSARSDLLPLPAMIYGGLLIAAAVLVWVASVRAMSITGAGTDDEPEARVTAPVPESRDSSTRRPVTDDEGTFEEWLFGDQQPSEQGEAAATQPVSRGSPGSTGSHGSAAGAAAADELTEACGYIVIFTLREGAARAFDRLVESTVQAIHDNEPGTIVYTCHAVQEAPQQRIFYELYRDKAAMAEHESQQHVRRFLAEREQYVLATNVVRLKLNSHTGVRRQQAGMR